MPDISGIARAVATTPVRPWQTGLVVGAVAAVASFQPSLLPREGKDQAIMSGLSSVIGFGIGMGLDTAIRAAGTRLGGGAAGAAAARVGVAVLGIGGSVLLDHVGNPKSERQQMLRSIALTAGVVGAAGTFLHGEQRLAQVLAAQLPGSVLTWRGVLIGGMAAGGAALALRRWDDPSENKQRTVRDLAGPIAGIAAAGLGTFLLIKAGGAAVSGLDRLTPGGRNWARLAFAGTLTAGLAFGVQHMAAKLSNAERPTNLDGAPVPGVMPQGPSPRSLEADTRIPRATLDHAGLRFIDGVTGGLPTTPLRAYAGLDTAATPAERAKAAVDELERQGAFEREAILVVSPTGSGYGSNILLEAAERLAKGDIASVSLQYNRLPSVMSIPTTDEGGAAHAELLRQIKDRTAELRASGKIAGPGPRVLVYGESLGAWASSVALRTGEDLDALGVDRVLWTGVPGLASWRAEDAPGVAREVHELRDLEALTDDEVDATRIFAFSHDDDPVHRFDVRNFLVRPEWTGEAGLPWIPIVSGLHNIGDLTNSMGHESPGTWRVTPHDYRGDIPELVRTAFGLDATDTELAEVIDELKHSEHEVHDWQPGPSTPAA